jgi:hypothetical protein
LFVFVGPCPNAHTRTHTSESRVPPPRVAESSLRGVCRLRQLNASQLRLVRIYINRMNKAKAERAALQPRLDGQANIQGTS